MFKLFQFKQFKHMFNYLNTPSSQKWNINVG